MIVLGVVQIVPAEVAVSAMFATMDRQLDLVRQPGIVWVVAVIGQVPVRVTVLV